MKDGGTEEMRLLMIRHGDPDYERDTLTERGVVEAQALAACAEKLELGTCYMSPLGRAVKTASYCLEATGKTAEIKDWLQEFPPKVDVSPDEEMQAAYPDALKEDGVWHPHIVWDIVPAYYTRHPELMDPVGWRSSKVARMSGMAEVYDYGTSSFDELLASYGYVREEGGLYRVEKEYPGTLTFFCHFGLTSVLLSHLWNVSPFVLLQHLVMAPSSVTEVFTEERQKGAAHFRATHIGDISHLTLAGLAPSFHARFCEVYSREDQRH